ncbi:MAG TPA: MerR family transcriptional regulator, partial [Candidatus Saccharimonadales bacterium]|nr:MerR family transcriptional regulator [Candidatus Saccharimonadales bacterium]
MPSAQSTKLLSLKQASELLGVSTATLLTWDKQDILKPVFLSNGKIVFTKEQIEKFMQIRDLSMSSEETKSEPENIAKENVQAEFIPEIAIAEISQPESKLAPKPGKNKSLEERFILWVGNGFYSKEQVKNHLKSQVQDSVNLELRRPDFSFKPPVRNSLIMSGALVLVLISLLTQQSRIKFLMMKYQTGSTNYLSIGSKSVLGTQTSKLKLGGSVIFRLPVNVKDKVTVGKTLEVAGKSVFKSNITAPNILYSVKGGDNVSISGDKQNPTISVDLPITVNSIQGQTGDIKLKAGDDISITGLTISDISTLDTVVSRGTCAACLTDEAVADNLTIGPGGKVAAEAIKGILTPAVGGTGLSTYAQGDLIYASASDTLANLPIGTAGQFLTVGTGGIPSWDNVGSFAVAVVKQDDVVISPLTNSLDFTAGDFNLNVNPIGEVNIQLASTLTNVNGVANNFNVGGNTLSFSGQGLINSTGANSITIDSGTTGSVNVGTGNNPKTVNIATGTGGNQINIATDNTTPDQINIGSLADTVNLNGTVTANNLNSNNATITGGSINNTPIGNTTPSSATFTTLTSTGNTNIATGPGATTIIGDPTGSFQLSSTGLNVSVAGGITLPNTQTLTIGTIGLSDAGINNLTSGANLVGVFDNLVNSSSNNLQQVLKDLDSSITSAGVSPFTIDTDGTYGDFIRPTTTSDHFTLGGDGTPLGSTLFFNAATANLSVGTNNTGSGGLNGTLTLFSSGNGITDTSLTTNSVGDLLIPNGNVGLGVTPSGVFKLEAAGHIGPSADAIYDLGSSSKRFRNLYLSGTTTSDGDITISNVDPSLRFEDTSPSEDDFAVLVNNSTFTIQNETQGRNDLVINSLGDFAIAGGSGSTGCTITNSSGDLTCSGNITTTNTSGTVGFFTRNNATSTISPTTSGDNLATSGNITTSGSGAVTSAGLLTASNGLTLSTGALNLTATSGALSLSGLSASSISTGANALTITSSNLNVTASGINATAIGATTPSSGAFTIFSTNGTTTLGDQNTDALTINASIQGQNALRFEGATVDAFGTTLAVTNPTQNNTITLPNATGTVAVSATGPITLSTAGDIACPTCLTGSIGSSQAVLLAPTVAQIDNSTNTSININKTGIGSLLNLTQSGSLSTNYVTSDASINRNFTGGANSLGGSILSLTDASTTNGSNSPTGLNISFATPSGSAIFSGNYVNFQRADVAGGSLVSKFSVSATGNVNASGTINSATLSGGTLSGGSVSGGSLTGGTYTGSGFSVTGNYTGTINNGGSFNISDGTSNLFTITDAGTQGDLSNIRALTASGTITLSNLTANGPVYTSAGGVLNSEAQLAISRGGTNSSSFTNNSVVYFNGTSLSSVGQAQDGQLIIGSTGGAPVLATLTGTPDQINIANGSGSITISTPQDIATTSSPTFANLTLNGTLTLANSETIDNAIDGTFTFGRNNAGAVTITSKNNGANSDLIIKPSGTGTLSLGSLTTPSITLTTSSTGDSSLNLPLLSVSGAEMVNDTVTSTQLAQTLTFSNGDLLDLSAIDHTTSSLQGLRLPNVASSSPTGPASGEGYLAYDYADNKVIFYNGSTWDALASGASSSKWTEDVANNIIFPNNVGRNLSLSSTLVSPFSVDFANNTVRVGDGSTANGNISLFASNGATGSLIYNASDQFEFSAGDVKVDNNLLVTGSISGATATNTINNLIFNGTGGISGTLTSITPSGAFTLGSQSQNLTLQGATTSLTSTATGVTNTLIFATPASGNKTITIPNATGTVAVTGSGVISLNTSGDITCPNCLTSGGSGNSIGVILAPSAAQTDATTNNSIFINKTGIGSLLNLTQSSSLASAYTTNDLLLTRNLTGGGNSRGGTLLTLSDTSTGSGTNNPTGLLISELTQTGSSLYTGNFVDFQRSDVPGGALVSKFSVSSSGNVTASGTINGLTITNNGTNTLNIATGKTLAVNNSLTFSGTDATSFTFPTTSGGTVLTSNAPSQSITSPQTSGSVFSLNDSTALTGAITGQSISLSGTGAFDQTGLRITLSGATGSNLNALVVNNGTVDTAFISKAGLGSFIGVNANSGLIQGTGGETVTGTVNLNATGGADTNIGTGTGNVSLGNGTGSLTLSGFSTNGGLLYTNGSGVLAQTGAGTATQVLHGGATPTYSAVSLTAD